MRRLLILCIALVTNGCAPIHASSSRHIKPADTTTDLLLSTDAAMKEIVDVFLSRRATLVDRSQVGNETILKFKGSRSNLTTGAGADGYSYVETNTVGSVYYASVVAVTPRVTAVRMFGKPTINGNEVCSDEDKKEAVGCSEVYTGALWTGRQHATGREEAEVIRGVLLELSLKHNQSADPAAVEALKNASVQRQSSCEAQRDAMEAKARLLADQRERFNFRQSIPKCD